MYIMNGIAYAGEPNKDIKVESVKVLDDMMLLIAFNTGEKRLYDASQLLKFPAFQPLKDEKIFRDITISYGVITWLDGDVDIAPETLYVDSYKYEEQFLIS